MYKKRMNVRIHEGDAEIFALTWGAVGEKEFGVADLPEPVLARIRDKNRPPGTTLPQTRQWLGRRLRLLDGKALDVGECELRLVTVRYSEGNLRPSRYKLESIDKQASPVI